MPASRTSRRTKLDWLWSLTDTTTELRFSRAAESIPTWRSTMHCGSLPIIAFHVHIFCVWNTQFVTVFFHVNFFGLFGFSLVHILQLFHRRTFYRPDVLLVTKPTLSLLTASAITSQSLLRLLLFFRKVWFLCSLHPGFYYGGEVVKSTRWHVP